MKKILLILLFSSLSFFGHSQNNTLPDLEAYFSALIVNDIENSISWYSNTLGFNVLNKIESEDSQFKQANLKRGAILIELIEINSAVSPKDVIPNYDSKTRLVGIFKTGFLVSDFDRWMKHLTQLEVDFHGNVVINSESGKKMVIIKDPDGNRIQIFEK